MSDQAGGAAPRRGFKYQDLAAAYFFITGDLDYTSDLPEKLFIERYDSDFYFSVESTEGVKQHFFESKYIDKGELKWSKFKDSVFTEFYRISENHAEKKGKNENYYHLVTNGAVAKDIADFVDDAESLRHGTPWTTFEKMDGRVELTKLQSAINSDSQAIEDDDVAMPNNKSDLYHPVWGLIVHTPTFNELKADLENHLRDCAPANFRTPMIEILEEISETDSGIINRRELEQQVGISLDADSQSTDSASDTDFEEIKEQMNSIRDSFSSSSTNTPQIRQKREDVREFGDQLNEVPETDDASIEASREILDDQFEKLEQLDVEKNKTEAQIGQQLEHLLEQAQSISHD